MFTEDVFKNLCWSGEFEALFELVEGDRRVMDARNLLTAVIKTESYKIPGILDRALEIFIKAADYKYCGREYREYPWSLSFFDGFLWHRRDTEWLKRLYRTAIAGALNRSEGERLYLLAEHFAIFSRWDDDSVDFYFVPATLKLIEFYDPKHNYARARILARKFNSEIEFLQWKILQPEAISDFKPGPQEYMIDLDKIDRIIQRLAELGVPTSKFGEYSQSLLEKQLGIFRERLFRTRDTYKAGKLMKAIEITENQLLLVSDKKS